MFGLLGRFHLEASDYVHDEEDEQYHNEYGEEEATVDY